jgi:hypothetical protein
MLDIYEGMPHVFQGIVVGTPETQQSMVKMNLIRMRPSASSGNGVESRKVDVKHATKTVLADDAFGWNSWFLPRPRGAHV